MSDSIKEAMIKLVVTIVDRGKGAKVTKIYNEEDIHFHFICHGEGTASSEILDLLGIGSSDKDLVFSMVPDYKVSVLISEMNEKMHLNRAGRGIMFTLPISGIGSIISRVLSREVQAELEEKLEQEVQKDLEQAKSIAKNSLIITIVNKGHTDKVMAAAKEAGARGGTILQARGAGYKEAENFLGISIQAEKELVMILTPREDRSKILTAINKEAGIKTEARGIIFSIPVEQMAGIN